jgi:hypothetical protein
MNSRGQFQAQQAVQLARATGMPELREPVSSRHIVLHAHFEPDVLLLSLHHERRSTGPPLADRPPGDDGAGGSN